MKTKERKKELEATIELADLRAEVNELKRRMRYDDDSKSSAILSRIEIRSDIEKLFAKINRLEDALKALKEIVERNQRRADSVMACQRITKLENSVRKFKESQGEKKESSSGAL